MMNKLNKKNKKKKGFTLIELIIVIAILAILAAVAVPQFGKIRENANRSADIANAKTISNAISTLLAEDQLVLPEATKTAIIKFDGKNDNDTANGMVSDKTTLEGVVTTYLQSTPKPKMSKYKSGHFTAVITETGKITVYINDDTAIIVYPEQDPSTGSLYYPKN